MKTVLLAAILALILAAPAAADVPRLDIRTAKQIRDEPKVPARLTVGRRTHRIGIELRGQGTQLHREEAVRLRGAAPHPSAGDAGASATGC